MESYQYVFISLIWLFKLISFLAASSFHGQVISRKVTIDSRVTELLLLGEGSVLSRKEIANFSVSIYAPTTTQEGTTVRIWVTQTFLASFPLKTSSAFHSSWNCWALWRTWHSFFNIFNRKKVRIISSTNTRITGIQTPISNCSSIIPMYSGKLA